MAKLEFMLMFICLTSMVVEIDSANINDKKIKRLEDRLFNIEENMDEEARIRRYDIRNIMDKLVEIEEEITNKTFTVNVVEERADDISLAVTKPHNTSLILTLLRAFQTEKKLSRRTRRHIDDLKTELGNMTNLIPELMEEISDVNSKVDDVVKAINDLKDITIKEMKDTMKANAMSTLNKLDKLTVQGNTINEIKQLLTHGTKRFASCLEWLKDGYTDNGLYDIYPNNRPTPIRVYCDQTTDGGGWIVFQRRKDGSVDFYRGWVDYENGFGNPKGEFWLGNEYLHLLTTPCCRELRIDMEDFENNRRYVKYGKFGIGPKATKYKLTINEYTGNTGDSLKIHNNAAFTTHDNDNDSDGRNCASVYKGAWWYNSCHESNLNGHYYLGAHDSYADGVNWQSWKGYKYSLKFTEIKLR